MSGDLLIFYKTLALANERNLYMKEKKARRISSVLLALLLCIAMLPAGVFADNEGDITSDQSQEIAAEAAVTDGEVAAEPAAAPDADPSGCTHTYLKTVQAKKASCKETGTVQHYECPDCGKKFLDKECTQLVTDESQLIIPIDPSAHEYGEWKTTRKATPEQKGEKTRTCKLCGNTDTMEIDYTDTAESFTLDGVKVTFKSPVYKTPEKDKTIVPGRVWVKGLKTGMKVCWKNPANLEAIDGVIVLRATGSSKEFKEVKRLKFKTVEDGETVVDAKTACGDNTANKKNTVYTYRVISFVKQEDVVYISHISKNDWAAGQTGTSKLKNIDSSKIAKMNKKSAKLQSKGTVTLKPVISNPKTKFRPSSRRWTSSNKEVAVVSSKGVVTARAPGSATIRCRMASGYEIASKITVVGAFKPGKPTIKVDFALTDSITLMWNKVKYATSYDVYKSNDGLHWDKEPRNTKKTKIKIAGLTKNHRYTFYVVARNDHSGLDKDGYSKIYTALSDNSNVINQKAVVKRRKMTLTGFPTQLTPVTGTTLSVTVKVDPPLGRKAQLQMKSGKKWVNKKTVTLPKGAAAASATIVFPDSWWGTTSEWRLVIPHSTTTEGYTTNTLTIKARRMYQNPSGYVQIQDKISKHGYNHYVAPILVNGTSTKSNHIEAFIKTAVKYMGDKYVQSRSGAPGNGIDESGLIIQACYGAGVDLWPISPSTRPYNCVPKIMSSKLKAIKYIPPATEDSNDYAGMTRGDLVFFSTSKGGTPTHVAIYTGLGGLVHADPVRGKVGKSTIRQLVNPEGKYKYYVVGVRRIFN